MNVSILDELEKGRLRAAEKKDGGWVVNREVKQAILDTFRQGQSTSSEKYFFDKDTLPPRQFTLEDNIRLVPRGSTVRRGSYIAPGVIIMPPSYINVGAWIGGGCMVDSHVLVGSCAQIGTHVHLSAGVKIGGVLEPIGESPVIIEDGAFIGAGAIIVEGVCVGEEAVVAPGVVLSHSIPIFDCVAGKQLEKKAPIPPRAVVVGGTRSGVYKNIDGYSLASNCALIIKYRDSGTATSLKLESALRK